MQKIAYILIGGGRQRASCVAPDDGLEAAEARLLVGPPLLCTVVGNPQLELVYRHQVEA